MFIQLVFLIAAVNNQPTKFHQYAKQTAQTDCLKYFPNNNSNSIILTKDIKYGQSNPSYVTQLVDYCSQYKLRTCCDIRNFATIQNIVKRIHLAELSQHCKTKLQQLQCYSCNAEVGLGYIDGLCDNYCQEIYQDCKDDYFYIDEQTNIIRPCTIDNLVCTKLSSIYDKSAQFCTALNYPINNSTQNMNIDKLVSQINANQQPYKMCYQNLDYEFAFEQFIDKPQYQNHYDTQYAKIKQYQKLLKYLAIAILTSIIFFIIYIALFQDNSRSQGTVIGGNQNYTYQQYVDDQQQYYLNNQCQQNEQQYGQQCEHDTNQEPEYDIQLIDSSEFKNRRPQNYD